MCNLNITIPKPCHEDWNKMTPDERGAFCKVCNKSVYDFSKKKKEEIESILTEKILAGEKVCGRFSVSQIDQPEERTRIFSVSTLRKFAAAIFLVFGSFLFSAKAKAQIMGKICYRPKNPPKTEQTVKGDTVMNVKTPIDTSKVDKTVKGNVKTIKKEPEELKMVGEIMYVPPKKVVEEKKLPKIDTAKTKPIEIKKEKIQEPNIQNYTTGAVVMTVKDQNSVCNNQKTVTNEKQHVENTPVIDKKALELSCYPNPARDEVQVKYVLKEGAQVKIELFDITGRPAKTLLSPVELCQATYVTSFDVSSLNAGTYICLLTAGNRTASTKVILAK